MLLSTLLVYRSNFHVMHWNAKGCHFDFVHSQAATYYDKLLADSDKVAEMAMRLGQNCVNYPEAYDMLHSANNDFVIVPSETKYNLADFCKFTATMFKDIISIIGQVLATEEIKSPSNVGIKASLEGMYDEYDLQLRYLNARRMEE